jgi:hypothetical protein
MYIQFLPQTKVQAVSLSMSDSKSSSAKSDKTYLWTNSNQIIALKIPIRLACGKDRASFYALTMDCLRRHPYPIIQVIVCLSKDKTSLNVTAVALYGGFYNTVCDMNAEEKEQIYYNPWLEKTRDFWSVVVNTKQTQCSCSSSCSSSSPSTSVREVVSGSDVTPQQAVSECRRFFSDAGCLLELRTIECSLTVPKELVDLGGLHPILFNHPYPVIQACVTKTSAKESKLTATILDSPCLFPVESLIDRVKHNHANIYSFSKNGYEATFVGLNKDLRLPVVKGYKVSF